jgi:hypothetical protein
MEHWDFTFNLVCIFVIHTSLISAFSLLPLCGWPDVAESCTSSNALFDGSLLYFFIFYLAHWLTSYHNGQRWLTINRGSSTLRINKYELLATKEEDTRENCHLVVEAASLHTYCYYLQKYIVLCNALQVIWKENLSINIKLLCMAMSHHW